MEAVIKLYSLGYKQAKTYLAAALFTLGNMIVPQLCHILVIQLTMSPFMWPVL